MKTPRVFTAADVVQVRTDQLTAGDLLARGREPGQAGYTAMPVLRAYSAGYSAYYGQPVWRVEKADHTAFVQPGHFMVAVIRRDAR